MTRSIGGALTTEALTRLHFLSLSPAEQAAAVRRLAATGQGTETISRATGLAPAAIRQVLAGKDPA